MCQPVSCIRVFVYSYSYIVYCILYIVYCRCHIHIHIHIHIRIRIRHRIGSRRVEGVSLVIGIKRGKRKESEQGGVG